MLRDVATPPPAVRCTQAVQLHLLQSASGRGSAMAYVDKSPQGKVTPKSHLLHAGAGHPGVRIHVTSNSVVKDNSVIRRLTS